MYMIFGSQQPEKTKKTFYRLILIIIQIFDENSFGSISIRAFSLSPKISFFYAFRLWKYDPLVSSDFQFTKFMSLSLQESGSWLFRVADDFLSDSRGRLFHSKSHLSRIKGIVRVVSIGVHSALGFSGGSQFYGGSEPGQSLSRPLSNGKHCT